MPNIYIRSAAYPRVHLRMDRSEVTVYNGAGSGTVNCQYYGAGTEPQPGNWEAFELVPLSDGISYAIRSTAPGNGSSYLRMDGDGQPNAAGTVNCQYYAEGTEPDPGIGSWEAFQLVSIPGSPVFAILSVNFANVYLRMDGSRDTSWSGSGGGIVNCQYYAEGQPTAGSLEASYIAAVSL
jgi:hypothetical protein